jgi:single-stranded DNA-binding protein
MRSSAKIRLKGYVYQDAKCPNEQTYPNWVTFKLCVNKKYKDKNGEEQQDTTWFECKSNSESMSKNIKEYVKDKMGLQVEGIPKARVYTTNSGTSAASIEVLVTEFDILTYPKEGYPPENDKITYGTATLNKGAYPQGQFENGPLETGKYKIKGITGTTAPEVELRDDEIPF